MKNKKNIVLTSIILLIIFSFFIYIFSIYDNDNYNYFNNIELLRRSENDIDYLLVKVETDIKEIKNIKNIDFLCMNSKFIEFIDYTDIEYEKYGDSSLLRINAKIYTSDIDELIDFLTTNKCFLEIYWNKISPFKTLITVPFEKEKVK